MSGVESLAQPKLNVHDAHSARRIKRIAQHTGAKSYLEIGLFKGKTFNSVTFEQKVGVDPVLATDLIEQSDGVELFPMTSDKYFTTKHDGRLFDIVFLDGLHNFQQTFRDFCNSLVCSHPGTVWLIDDVLPSDVYSALPVAADARSFRKRAGGNSLAWHGDVYKLILTIHDFFPSLSYVCINNAGNPQGMVWKAPRTNFTPAFGTMEAIERCGYFDFLKREALMNLMPEEEAFQVLLQSCPGLLSPPAVPADS